MLSQYLLSFLFFQCLKEILLSRHLWEWSLYRSSVGCAIAVRWKYSCVCRRSPSSLSLELQVVPDILDDESKVAKAGTSSDHADSSRELEMQLREASAAGTEALPSASLWTSRSSLAALTETSCRPLSIVRLGSDARPLTPAEMLAHCHLLIPRTRTN